MECLGLSPGRTLELPKRAWFILACMSAFKFPGLGEGSYSLHSGSRSADQRKDALRICIRPGVRERGKNGGRTGVGH